MNYVVFFFFLICVAGARRPVHPCRVPECTCYPSQQGPVLHCTNVRLEGRLSYWEMHHFTLVEFDGVAFRADCQAFAARRLKAVTLWSPDWQSVCLLKHCYSSVVAKVSARARVGTRQMNDAYLYSYTWPTSSRWPSSAPRRRRRRRRRHLPRVVVV